MLYVQMYGNGVEIYGSNLKFLVFSSPGHIVGKGVAPKYYICSEQFLIKPKQHNAFRQLQNQ